MSWFKQHKVLTIVGIIAIIFLILFATGVASLDLTFTKTGSEPVTTDTEAAVPEKEGRIVTFGGNQKPSFTLELPRGWDTGSNSMPGVAVVVGSRQAEKTSSGTDFTANVNVVIDRHAASVTGIADYQAAIFPELQQQYPNMAKINDYVTQINGMDVYVVEVSNQMAEIGSDQLRQIQYWFYVDDTWGMAVTGSSLESAWGQRGPQIKSVIESITKAK